MLPRKNRLRKMKDFEILFKEGRFVADNLVNIKIWKFVPEKYPRRKYTVEDLLIGVVVGVKVHKSAVKRNKIKRQMREVVRLLLKENKIKSGYMMSVMAKPNIIDNDYSKIEKSILSVLKKAKVI